MRKIFPFPESPGFKKPFSSENHHLMRETRGIHLKMTGVFSALT